MHALPTNVALAGLPMPVLELVAFVAGVLCFHPLTRDVPTLAFTDSTVVAAIVYSHRARSPLLRLAHLALVQDPCCLAAVPNLRVAYTTSEANACADAASRLDSPRLADLAAQGGAHLRQLPFPRAASRLLAALVRLHSGTPRRNPQSPLAGVRVGEASHPGPVDGTPRDRRGDAFDISRLRRGVARPPRPPRRRWPARQRSYHPRHRRAPSSR